MNALIIHKLQQIERMAITGNWIAVLMVAARSETLHFLYACRPDEKFKQIKGLLQGKITGSHHT